MFVSVGVYDRGMVGQGFTFRLPGATEVPFGARVRVSVAGKVLPGVILGHGTAAEDVVIQDVLSLDDAASLRPAPWQCYLMLWISTFYYSPLHRVLRLFLPLPLWKGTFTPREQVMVHAAVAPEAVPARQKQAQALLRRLSEGSVPRETLREEFSAAVYNRAKAEGYIVEESLGLLPVRPWTGKIGEPRRLTVEQQAISDTMEARFPEKALLYGITGAGKTEIYLHRALSMKQKGLQTALLIPEIALTPQLVAYFQRVFGNRVAVIHSHLAEGEKCQEWLRVAGHEVDVIIGSRSAIFAPFASLGQIILDEEHEWTYKNEQNPRYLTHRVAEMIADIHGREGRAVGVLYASGTPSIERFARAKDELPDADALHLYTLEERIYDQTQQ